MEQQWKYKVGDLVKTRLYGDVQILGLPNCYECQKRNCGPRSYLVLIGKDEIDGLSEGAMLGLADSTIIHSKFQIGDKVQTKGGTLGTIEEIISPTPKYSIRESCTCCTSVKEESNLELAPIPEKPPAKFKVGDLVVALGTYGLTKGCQIVIKKVEDRGDHWHYGGNDKGDERNPYLWNMREQDIRLFQESDMKFKVGDRIRILPNNMGAKEGIGIIRELASSGNDFQYVYGLPNSSEWFVSEKFVEAFSPKVGDNWSHFGTNWKIVAIDPFTSMVYSQSPRDNSVLIEELSWILSNEDITF